MNENEPNNELNKLENHIDDPIKKCVVGMALLGFKPLMSCCGFSYRGEKVPKKHLEKAYMYLSYPDIKKGFMEPNLLQIASLSGWKLDIIPGDHFIDFYAKTWRDTQPSHPWNDAKCPHFHETFVIGISALEKTLTSLKQYFQEKVQITDGNTFYKENCSKYWQYEPTEPWEVTPEIFDKL